MFASGDYDLAVLCKREIKLIDLNEGRFKVKELKLFSPSFPDKLNNFAGHFERCHESKDAVFWIA